MISADRNHEYTSGLRSSMAIDINIIIVIVSLSVGLATFFAILAIYRAANKPTRSEVLSSHISSIIESEIEADDYDFDEEETKRKTWSQYWLSLYESTGRTAEDEKTPGRVPIIIGILGFFIGFLVYPGDIIGGIVGGGVLPLIPFFWMRFEAGRRAKALDKQLPLLLNSLRSNLQGSLTPQAALLESVEEVPSPLGDELNKVKKDIEVNIPMWEALRRMSDRVESHDIKFMLSAIEIAIVEGSDLDKQLEVIQGIVRQRVRIRQRLEAAVAQVQPSLWISIFAIPASLLFSIYSSSSNKDFWLSFIGILAVIVIGMLYAIGLFISRLLVKNIENA